ncbi:MAG TPA: hypothetical protein VGA61_19745, partial [Anaerolineae bacterium]
MADQEPIQDTTLSAEMMDETPADTLGDWAHTAAAEGEVTHGPGAEPWLLAGLEAQEALLQSTVDALRTGGTELEVLSHAAEWLLDNFYLAQQSVREIREDMPRGFYRRLPKLVGGPLQGYPRIYDLARRLVEDSGAQLDLERVQRFVAFYQEETPLTTGELWALPVMLRFSVLAVLAQAAGQIMGFTSPATNPAERNETVTRPLKGPLSNDDVVANCFTSLRSMATHDWQSFFERVSQVEQILRDDPAGVYAIMDRATRDRYRGIVEEIALATAQTEPAVAQAAVALAAAASHEPAAAPRAENVVRRPDQEGWESLDLRPEAHVGYYLL